jgi:hypothetical protein
MAFLIVTGTIGTVSFYLVELSERRKQNIKEEMIKSSSNSPTETP